LPEEVVDGGVGVGHAANIHGHLARPAQHGMSTKWHEHDGHEHDAARRPSCSCRAGTTCRARGTARRRFVTP
jgi:hypothetical protein